jgi:lipoprotein-releasing system permease protein
MNLPVNLEISKTHLLARKKQTLIAILGVTFGIAMFIVMISFMQGANKYFETTLLQVTPDIHIYNDVQTDYSHSIAGDYFKNGEMVFVHHPKPKQVTLNIKSADQIIGDLEKNPAVAVVSPHVSTQVFYNYGPVQINGLIDGVDIIKEARLYGLADKIMTGKIENMLTTNDGILMGQGLADKLNVRLGDMVNLATPSGTSMRFRIVGTFQIGFGTIDNVKSYVNTSNVQQLLGKDRSYITDINMKLKNIANARPLAASFQKKYGYKADDWETTNASIMSSFIIRDILTYVVSFTLLVVAGFGIYNIMNMTIASKMKDIAILKAEGFGRKDIVQIFLSQSLVIGVLGALTGILIGFGLSLLLSHTPFPKNEFVTMKYLPIIFEPKHYLFAVLFGTITTFIAGLMPSVNASKVDPVAILRG